MNNYQPNQILKSFNSPYTYYLVIGVYPKYLELKDLSTGAFPLRPSINSVFLDYCTLIGTADSHPELLI